MYISSLQHQPLLFLLFLLFLLLTFHSQPCTVFIPPNMYYLTNEDVMYCYIPKNACSRFKALLRLRESITSGTVHSHNGLQRLVWLSYQRALQRLSTYQKFIVIRDPFSRLASAYVNKIAKPWPQQRFSFWKHLNDECPGIASALIMPEKGALMSMETFLKCLQSKDTIKSNEHWLPQSQLCALNHVTYQHILHVETLLSDTKALLRALNWNHTLDDFDMKQPPVYSRNISQLFTPLSIQLTLQYYKNDFALLPYSKHPSGIMHFYSVYTPT